MSPTAFVTFAMVGAILAGTVVGLVEIARHTIAGIQRRADEPIPYLPISDGVIVTDVLARRDARALGQEILTRRAS